MSKEIEGMLKNQLTLNQQRLSVHYSVLFLRNEAKDIMESIEQGNNETFKKLLRSRLIEIQRDLNMFEKLNDECV